MKRRVAFLVALVVVGAVVVWIRLRGTTPSLSDADSSQVVEWSGATMGGTWSVKIPHAMADEEKLHKRVADELARLDSLLSLWHEDSEVSRFNRPKGVEWISVSKDLAEIVSVARQVSEETGGAFDITIAPLVNLWGFGPAQSGGRNGVVSAEAEIAAARARVGWRGVEARVSPPALRKARAEIAIDLGAIGKGYAADAVARILDSAGVKDYLIAIGGELRGHGHSASGAAWKVGVETPVADVQRVLLSVELKEQGISTSGDYRNFFEMGGVRYCHEIDPRTGWPIAAARGLAGVSVIHSSSVRADALATGFFVLGAEEGFKKAEEMGIAALFVTRGQGKFEMKMTKEFAGPVKR